MDKFDYEVDDSCTDLECAPIVSQDDQEWGPYKYLGPGTDVYGKVSKGVKPINGLDAAAMNHDIAYWNISKAYEVGDIELDEAYDRIDKADWELANAAFVDMAKSGVNLLPDILKAIGGGDPLGALVGAIKALPSTLTSEAMRTKWLLSKLRISRGSFANLKRGAPRRLSKQENYELWFRNYRKAAGHDPSESLAAENYKYITEEYIPFPERWSRWRKRK